MASRVQPLARPANSEPPNHFDASLHSNTEEGREFTLFPKLPLELREKIWLDAIPDPRIIRVEGLPYWTTIQTQTAHEDGNSTIAETREHFRLRFTSTEGDCSLSLVCTESRNVILRPLLLFLPSATVGREIRFRQSDLVVIKDPEALAGELERVVTNSLENPECLSHLHTLAVFGDLYGLDEWNFHFDVRHLRALMPYCKNLRTLCFLFRDGGGHLCDQGFLTDYTSNLSVTAYISKLSVIQRSLREERFTKLILQSQELQQHYVGQLRLYGEESKEAAHLSSLEVEIMVYSPPKPNPRLWPGWPELTGSCLTSSLQSLRDPKPSG